MRALFSNLLTASVSGSIVILAVLVLRLVLRKTPKKFICILWMVAGLRLLLPVPLQSRFSLQPPTIRLPQSETLQTYLVPLWCIVAVSLLCASLISYAHLRRQVKDARKIRGGWECEGLETAFVLGFLKPKIYIPAGVSDNTRQQILAHERTHLDKGDHWIKLIGFLALVLHWFNPLVWVSYILLCKDIEMACDQRVVQFMDLPERKAYSAALLDCSTHKVHYAACPVAFGEVSVKYRIKSVLSYKKPAFWMSLSGVLAIAFVAVCLGTNPVEKQEDPEAALVQSSRQNPETFAPATAPASLENPDWGVTSYVSECTPTGGTLTLEIEERFCQSSDSIAITDASLERWNGTDWEEVPSLSGGKILTFGAMGFAQSRPYATDTWPIPMDWSLRYGSLSDGDYRVKAVMKSDTQSATFYAPFQIYREALPSAEESALARCTAALQSLYQRGCYSILISQKQAFGDGLSPVLRLTRMGNTERSDYYAGNFLASSKVENYSFTEESPTDWTEPFTLSQNRRFLFPEGQSTISDQLISFRSAWADPDGNTYYGTDSYSFDSSGNLIGVDRVVENTEKVLVAHDRMEVITLDTEECTDYLYEASTQAPENSFEASNNSPWKIFFRVDDDYLTPTGGEVWVAWNGLGAGSYTIDSVFWLEKMGSRNWERLLGSDVTCPFDGSFSTLSSRTQMIQTDWSPVYGFLDAGLYRMGAKFFNGSQSLTQYAEFTIGAVGGIYGDGAEAAIARVDAAIAKLKSGPYHAKQFSRHGGDDCITEEYWSMGENMAVCFYNDAGSYSHSIVESGEDRLWANWCNYDTSRQPYYSIYFPEGESIISDREISFLYSFSSNAWCNPLYRYTYRFDEQGNLTELEWYFVQDGPEATIRYCLEPTTETEVQEKLQQL
ncbi:MAG: M56 family metallopeptidase, partial [Clostridiales bacterium]|nr:M56 family metallopeptidase [Clostridiales bacterium]